MTYEDMLKAQLNIIGNSKDQSSEAVTARIDAVEGLYLAVTGKVVEGEKAWDVVQKVAVCCFQQEENPYVAEKMMHMIADTVRSNVLTNAQNAELVTQMSNSLLNLVKDKNTIEYPESQMGDVIATKFATILRRHQDGMSENYNRQPEPVVPENTIEVMEKSLGTYYQKREIKYMDLAAKEDLRTYLMGKFLKTAAQQTGLDDQSSDHTSINTLKNTPD